MEVISKQNPSKEAVTLFCISLEYILRAHDTITIEIAHTNAHSAVFLDYSLPFTASTNSSMVNHTDVSPCLAILQL
jgi:hypothetical protein